MLFPLKIFRSIAAPLFPRLRSRIGKSVAEGNEGVKEEEEEARPAEKVIELRQVSFQLALSPAPIKEDAFIEDAFMETVLMNASAFIRTGIRALAWIPCFPNLIRSPLRRRCDLNLWMPF